MENSIPDIQREVIFLKHVAQTTGVNIIAGTGMSQ